LFNDKSTTFQRSSRTIFETINDWQNVARFVNINISQGSVATHLMYVGISINNFIASFLLNVWVKEL